VSNVISFCDYKQKKIEDIVEKECEDWSLSTLGLDTVTFTVTIDGDDIIIE